MVVKIQKKKPNINANAITIIEILLIFFGFLEF
jgi:hypothetical protein